MGNHRILIANADPAALAEYGRALEQEWSVQLVAGPDAALAAMTAHPADVVVADCALPEANQGVELLDRIHADFPKTIRILLAGELDNERRMADVAGSHLILPKPCDIKTLTSAIQRALAIDHWLTNDSLRQLVSRLRTFPIVPSLYLEVISALKSPHVTTVEVGGIIAKDMAMMTKLLQVTNSACFGLPRKISDPVEAVGILGFETVKSMVITLKLLSQYDKVRPVYFSIDRLWRHSTEVARLSRMLAFAQEDDPALAESAFTAGLMHDLGKLVLASNFDEQYSGAQALARHQQIPLWEVEKQIFGASHGEIGAYLLGLWGMPLDLVEAAALHHNPSRCLAKRFTPLTAVHVANALLYEARPDKEGFVPAQIDEAYLAELGLSARLPHWRKMVLTPDSGTGQPRATAGQAGGGKHPAAAGPAPSPPSAKTVPAAPSILGVPRQRWACSGILAVLFLITFLLCAQAFLRMALAPVIPPEKPAAAAIRNPQSAPSAVALAKAEIRNPAVSPEKAAAAKPPVPVAAVTPPAAGAAPAAAPAAPPPPSAKDLAFAELHLQSIFYSQSNPSAVISGRRVQPNDRLPAGAVVVAIGPSSVTLEFDKERKILALK